VKLKEKNQEERGGLGPRQQSFISRDPPDVTERCPPKTGQKEKMLSKRIWIKLIRCRKPHHTIPPKNSLSSGKAVPKSENRSNRKALKKRGKSPKTDVRSPKTMQPALEPKVHPAMLPTARKRPKKKNRHQRAPGNWYLENQENPE